MKRQSSSRVYLVQAGIVVDEQPADLGWNGAQAVLSVEGQETDLSGLRLQANPQLDSVRSAVATLVERVEHLLETHPDQFVTRTGLFGLLDSSSELDLEGWAIEAVSTSSWNYDQAPRENLGPAPSTAARRPSLRSRLDLRTTE